MTEGGSDNDVQKQEKICGGEGSFLKPWVQLESHPLLSVITSSYN